MKRWIALASAVLAAGTLHAAAGQAPAVHIANPELLAALQAPEAALQAARTPLAFDGGASASNCREYADLMQKGPPAESARNFEIRSEYLLCDALRLTAGKPFAAEKPKAAGRQAKALYERLDLRTFPSSLHQRADEKKHTLKTLLPGTPEYDGGAVAVDTPDQRFRLEVVGTVDQGRGKKPDWIVWVSDESKTGSYRGYSTIVVHPPRTASGPYTAADPARP